MKRILLFLFLAVSAWAGNQSVTITQANTETTLWTSDGVYTVDYFSIVNAGAADSCTIFINHAMIFTTMLLAGRTLPLPANIPIASGDIISVKATLTGTVFNMFYKSYPSGGGGGAVSSVFGRTGDVTANTGDYTYSKISGIAIKRDTSDHDTNGLGGKVDKVTGKGLSTNDYTTAEQTKLSGIATGATVGADWNTNLSNIPSTFPPSSHYHAIADVTGLQTALDGKLSTSGTAADVNTSGTSIAAALSGKLSTSGTAADVNTSGTNIASALSGKLSTSGTAADVNVSGTAIAAALAGKASASHTHTESQISLSDNTTDNVSTSMHGFCPKITSTSNFLKGDGTWATITETDPVVKAINGIVKSNGTTISAATAGTDYQTPYTNLTSIGSLANGTGCLRNNGSGTFTYNDSAAKIPNGTAQYQFYITGASPYTPSWTTEINLASIGGLANGTGALYNNGSGTFTYRASDTIGLGTKLLNDTSGLGTKLVNDTSGSGTKLINDTIGIGQRTWSASLTADAVAYNTSTETTLLTKTCPLAALTAGTVFICHLDGSLQLQATSGTVTYRVYLGATAGQTLVLATQTSAVAPCYHSLDAAATIRTTGSSGTYLVNGCLMVCGTTVLYATQSGKTTSTINTTADITVKITVQFATASTTNADTVRNGYIAIGKL